MAVTEFFVDPIASKDQFKDALLVVRDKKKLSANYLTLLKFHCQAPGHTITPAQIAETLGLATLTSANLQIGTLGHLIADALGYSPQRKTGGGPMWWNTIAYGRGESANTLDSEFELVMRPELVDALIEMRWAKLAPATSPVAPPVAVES